MQPACACCMHHLHNPQPPPVIGCAVSRVPALPTARPGEVVGARSAEISLVLVPDGRRGGVPAPRAPLRHPGDPRGTGSRSVGVEEHHPDDFPVEHLQAGETRRGRNGVCYNYKTPRRHAHSQGGGFKTGEPRPPLFVAKSG